MWVESHNSKGEKLNVSVFTFRSTDSIKDLFVRMGVAETSVYRKRGKKALTPNIPLTAKQVEVLEINEHLRLGEFMHEPILFWERVKTF